MVGRAFAYCARVGRERCGPRRARRHGRRRRASNVLLEAQPDPALLRGLDEGSYASGWSSIHTMFGSLALGTTEFTSPPGAMIAQSGATAQPAVADVAAYRSFALTGQNFTGAIELDLRVDRADLARAFAVLAQMKRLDGSGTAEYVLQLV